MTHIFEFYEETFPEHSIKAMQGGSSSSTQQSSEKSERNIQYIGSNEKTVKYDLP